MPTLKERNEAYHNRCCDWHWGDSSGVGDPSEPCRGQRLPGRQEAELALLRELEALCSRLDARYDDGLRQHMGSRTADTMLDVLAKLDALRSR